MYGLVQHFADNFAAYALEGFEKDNSNSSIDEDVRERSNKRPNPLSRSEWRRFDLSIIRFELYCNLFRFHVAVGLGNSRRELWFKHFSFWESEQLACAYDYLSFCVEQGKAAVIPASIELYLHRGNSSSRAKENEALWTRRFDLFIYRPAADFHLCRGLAWIRPFLEATSNQQRWDFFQDPTNQGTDDFFLETEANEASHCIEEADIPLLTPDADTGPKDVWRWVQAQLPTYKYLFYAEQASLRKPGYVMWDRERLDPWTVWRRPWGSGDA